jgi:hypothetical protein
VKKDGATTLLPTADYRFDGSEHLMLFGRDADVDRIVKELR